MPKKIERASDLGKQQAHDINQLYNTFDDKQREAFLLGRISAFLVLGNAVTDGANEAIREAEGVLQEVRQRIVYAKVDSVEIKPKRTKTTAKKGAKKDE